MAHPDDETISCGALLTRLPNVTIIHLTDGAPRSLTDAKARGFDTAAAYAEARRGELEAATALAGVAPRQLVALGWPDQEACFHIVEIATELARRLAGTDAVITHAYEGGHPDHDTASLAVDAARKLLLRRGAKAPDIIEAPLYRAGPEGRRLVQDFEPWPGAVETVVELSPEEQELKRAMFAAHATQQKVLTWFSIATERFRQPPAYDFTRPPNGGDILYERFDWGMGNTRWLGLSEVALVELERV